MNIDEMRRAAAKYSSCCSCMWRNPMRLRYVTLVRPSVSPGHRPLCLWVRRLSVCSEPVFPWVHLSFCLSVCSASCHPQLNRIVEVFYGWTSFVCFFLSFLLCFFFISFFFSFFLSDTAHFHCSSLQRKIQMNWKEEKNTILKENRRCFFDPDWNLQLQFAYKFIWNLNHPKTVSVAVMDRPTENQTQI